MIVDGVPCIKIIDPEIKGVLLEKLDQDGNGEINVRESENVNLVMWFFQNKKIKTFNEAKKFKGLYSLNNKSFAESSIEEIEFTSGQSLAGGAFDNCPNLHHIVLPPDMTMLNWLSNNPALEYVELPESLITIDINQLSYSGLKEIVIPSKTVEVLDGVCRDCPNLRKVTILSQIPNISMMAFANTPNLKDFIIHADTPPLWKYNAFYNTNPLMKIYVPDASVNAYKIASNWKSRADYIYPISQFIE